MNKTEFLNTLEGLLAALPENERARLLAYYGEMIDDRMEEGLNEAEAVAALGDPAELAREFVAAGETSARSENAPAARFASDSDAYVDALRELHVHMKTADCVIRREPLNNGAALQIRASEPNAFEWKIDDGVLEITENPRTRRGLSILGFDIEFNVNRTLTLTLSDTVPERLIFDSHGGDLQLCDITVEALTVLSSSSGDIDVRRCECCGRVEINNRSGDVEADDVIAHGDFKIESISGDVDLRGVRAGNLRARTTSGDIEIERSTAGTANVNAVSGDLRLTELELTESLLAETTSGDIDLARANARKISLASASGDVDARLHNRAGGYAIDANTRSGDITLPEHWTEPNGAADQTAVSIHTYSGDIDVEII